MEEVVDGVRERGSGGRDWEEKERGNCHQDVK